MSLINSLAPWSYENKLTGNKLNLEVTPYYFKLSVNDREYYFNKDTGEFDGTAIPANG